MNHVDHAPALDADCRTCSVLLWGSQLPDRVIATDPVLPYGSNN
jgi:hypothetical protein